MSTIGQKQAVVSAVKKVLGDAFVDGETNVKEVLTSQQLEEIRKNVLDGILNGEVTYNKPTTDINAVRRYVNGMIDNHFRKAKELNGGATYTPSRKGAKRDTTLLNLNRLLTTYAEGTPEYSEVTNAITARQKELRKIKSKTKKDVKNSVNMDIIPPELKGIIE